LAGICPATEEAESSELGFQFGFDGLENLGPDFPYLSAVRLAD
jgi:hypothetical protein